MPIERKVAAGAGTGTAASLVILVLHLIWPNLAIDPTLVALIVTTLSGFAAYMAKHTHVAAEVTVVPPATTTGAAS